MKAPKVRVKVVMRCLTGGKWRYKDAAVLANHTLRPQYALINKKAEHHPEGHYYLRYSLGFKRRIYEKVADISLVTDKLRIRQRTLEDLAEARRKLREEAQRVKAGGEASSHLPSLALALAAPLLDVAPLVKTGALTKGEARAEILPPLPATTGGPHAGRGHSGSAPSSMRAARSMDTAIDLWLDEKVAHTKKGSVTAYKWTTFLWREFSQPHIYYVQDVSRADMMGFSAWLAIEEEYADKTVRNHFRNVMGLLAWNGVNLKALDPPVTKYDWPKVAETTVDIYEPETINPFWSACEPREKLLYKTFVGEGLREGEMKHVGWANLSPYRNVISVKRHPEYGWSPKMDRERAIPVQGWLMQELLKLRATATSPLIFPAENKKPDGTMLHRLKAIATRAGLNPEDFWLHKFRATFATICIRSRAADVVTVKDWMGHKMLASMDPYVKAAGCGPEVQRQFNQIEFP
jgi:integrase